MSSPSKTSKINPVQIGLLSCINVFYPVFQGFSDVKTLKKLLIKRMNLFICRQRTPLFRTERKTNFTIKSTVHVASGSKLWLQPSFVHIVLSEQQVFSGRKCSMPRGSVLNINAQRRLRASQPLTRQLAALWDLQSNYISYLPGFVTGPLRVCICVRLCMCSWSLLWCLFDVVLVLLRSNPEALSFYHS